MDRRRKKTLAVHRNLNWTWLDAVISSRKRKRKEKKERKEVNGNPQATIVSHARRRRKFNLGPDTHSFVRSVTVYRKALALNLPNTSSASACVTTEYTQTHSHTHSHSPYQFVLCAFSILCLCLPAFSPSREHKVEVFFLIPSAPEYSAEDVWGWYRA